MTELETQTRIYHHLESVIARMRQVIDAPTDTALKRIEVDAAAIATLTTVSELLPEHLQEAVRTIVALHESTWNIDMPAEGSATPRKPLSEELLNHVMQVDTNDQT